MYRKLIHVFILSSLHLIKHAFQETTSTYDVIFKRNERVDIEVLHMINPPKRAPVESNNDIEQNLLTSID